ncbi:SET domain-containing protein [Roseiterribacter gracilis]|uniref:SET domain-containing protein-lysine N-methyltransferase n=1 Tax=Roseiterribacter gracilis TaxID=2812848 RepID=A0A8S8XGG7_9PROT|nr:SET domain-containing protein-lysine N-methyltransferase [Rhodospirillales bacterium TMPK1]
MMLVPTYVAASAIHGLGLFAAEPIAAGTIVWRFAPGLDQVIPPERVNDLPAHARAFLDRYAFESAFFPNGLLLSFDDTRFINHADDPNIDNTGIDSIARRDIAANEELTCDYRELDGDVAFVGGA